MHTNAGSILQVVREASVVTETEQRFCPPDGLAPSPGDMSRILNWMRDMTDLMGGPASEYSKEEKQAYRPGWQDLVGLAEGELELARFAFEGLRDHVTADAKVLFWQDRAKRYPRYLHQLEVERRQNRERDAVRTAISDRLFEVVTLARELGVRDNEMPELLVSALNAGDGMQEPSVTADSRSGAEVVITEALPWPDTVAENPLDYHPRDQARIVVDALLASGWLRSAAVTKVRPALSSTGDQPPPTFRALLDGLIDHTRARHPLCSGWELLMRPEAFALPDEHLDEVELPAAGSGESAPASIKTYRGRALVARDLMDDIVVAVPRTGRVDSAESLDSTHAPPAYWLDLASGTVAPWDAQGLAAVKARVKARRESEP